MSSNRPKDLLRETFVYKLTRADGLEYIGITVNFKKRLSSHKNDLIIFPEEFIKKNLKVSQRESYKNIPKAEWKSPNGKLLNQLTLYAKYLANQENVSIPLMKAILNEKCYTAKIRNSNS